MKFKKYREMNAEECHRIPCDRGSRLYKCAKVVIWIARGENFITVLDKYFYKADRIDYTVDCACYFLSIRAIKSETEFHGVNPESAWGIDKFGNVANETEQHMLEVTEKWLEDFGYN